jgi:hypothetical protein
MILIRNIVYCALLLFFSACSSTSRISIEVLKPAYISVPQDIKTIAFVNRSLPSKKERVKNILEGIITGEVPFVDRQAAEKCINGAVSRLQGSPRFSALYASGLELKGTGTRQFPEPLDWSIVNDYCNKNKAEALAVLEVFDSNNMYSISERQATKKDGDKEIKYTEYVANLSVQIETGWRIYFPANKQIIDQNFFSDSRSWNNTGTSRTTAQQGLISIERAVADAGYYAGEQYAERISPLWTRVSRKYFKKGNDEMERAARYAQSNDWKGAAEIWQKLTNNSDPKIAGRATYNMAVACEMDGNLDEALNWAKTSYVDFKVKDARYYMNTIQQRINDQDRLKDQMGE